MLYIFSSNDDSVVLTTLYLENGRGEKNKKSCCLIVCDLFVNRISFLEYSALKRFRADTYSFQFSRSTARNFFQHTLDYQKKTTDHVYPICICRAWLYRTQTI